MLDPEIWPAEVVDGPAVMLIAWAEADHDSGIPELIREDVADPCVSSCFSWPAKGLLNLTVSVRMAMIVQLVNSGLKGSSPEGSGFLVTLTVQT